MSDDLDDNAETTAGLLEVVRRLVSTYKHLQMDTPKDQAILDKATDLAERALDTLAARLADSRPVVSEAAIEAAAEALWDHHDHDMKSAGYNCECGERLQDGWAISPARNAHCEHQARAALTAALPHMSDGRNEA